MYTKSPVKHAFGMVVWFLTSFAALHYGLMAMGLDLRATALLAPLRPLVDYLFGVSGLISLIMLVKHLMGGCSEC